MTSNDNHLQNLVREYAELQARTAPDLARMDEIKKHLRALDYGSHDIAGLKISVSRNTRLDAKAFSEKYPVLQFPHFYKSAPDSAAIKKHLAPVEIEDLSTEGDPRVTIK